MLTQNTEISKGISAATLVTATLGICTLSLALPMVTLQVYDRILPHPGAGTFPILIAGLCIAVVLEVILRLARARIIAWNGACYEHNLSCAAMNRALHADLRSFYGTSIGNHINGFAAISRIKDFFNGQSLVSIVEIILLPIYLVLMWYVAGRLVFIPLGFVIVFTCAMVFMGWRLRRTLSARDHADDKRYDFLVEALEGIHTLKSFALEERFQRRHEILERQSTCETYSVSLLSASMFNMSAVFGHIMLVAVISCGALLVLEGQITSGALIASILLSGRVMQPLQRIVALWVRFQDYRAGQEKIGAIMNLPQIRRQPHESDTPRKGSLQMRDVGMTAGEKWLFRGVNLDLRCGDSVRLSGAHGCGKSTLLLSIAGLYAPERGSILIDGRAPMDYLPVTCLRHVAMLRTHGIVFQGTIRDNITRFGAVPENQARDIVALLGIDREIAGLPRGFETVLNGTENDVIPPGLRQRLAIARSLAARPRLILFDNADRNLDRDGYTQVYSLLGKLKEKVAMIIVSDDNNLASLASRHFELTPTGLQPIGESQPSAVYGGKRI